MANGNGDMDREALIRRLMANVTGNPAAQGMAEQRDGGFSPLRPMRPGSFNPASPAGIERQAFTGRNPFAGGWPERAIAQQGHAGMAAQAMNMSNPQSGPSYGGSNPLNPFGEGNVTAGGLQAGDAGKQKNPLQQVGSAIKALVSFLIDQ
mgnify:FL=1|jgi:hypothetical protein|tara:strand:- start:64 stop:513 length:450 start_codon:yes stop_codon:yes gene_type:complete